MKAEDTGMVLEVLRINRTRFSWAWLRSVRRADVRFHCSRALVGVRHPRIRVPRKGSRGLSLREVPLEPVALYYLCAIARPVSWSSNVHLAFAPAAGSMATVEAEGFVARVRNARAIPIIDAFVPPTVTDPRFSTCRNFWLASQIAAVGLKSVTVEAPRVTSEAELPT